MLSAIPRFPAQFLISSSSREWILKSCSIYSREHQEFLARHVALVSCVMNLRRVSYPGFGKFMLDSKEALKRIIEICLVKPPEDFSSLCGILVSIRGAWQAQQLHRRSCNPSIMARCSKGSSSTLCWEIFLCFSAWQLSLPPSLIFPSHLGTLRLLSWWFTEFCSWAGTALKELEAKLSPACVGTGHHLPSLCQCTEGNAFRDKHRSRFWKPAFRREQSEFFGTLWHSESWLWALHVPLALSLSAAPPVALQLPALSLNT